VSDLLEDFGFPAPISERNLHSDRYMDQVLDDLPGFLKTYFDFPNDEFEPVHVYYALRLMFKGGRYVFQWSTDHAKSLTGLFFFPIASLASDPDGAHLIMGANEADSKSRLQMVQRELEHPRNPQLLADFPWLKKPRKVRDSSGGLTWSRKELTVDGRTTNNRNPSLYACTTGSNDVRGRRGKLVMDDIEGEDARRLASSRKQLYDFVKLEAVTCLEDKADSIRPLVCAMGTPFDIDSIYIKLENEDWETVKIPCYTVPWSKVRDYSHMTLPDGTQATTDTPWEERAALLPDRLFTWPRKRMKVCEHDPLFGKKLDKVHFSLRYLLDATAGDPTRLNYDQLRKLTQKAEMPTDGNWITVVSLDPAAGVGEDYAGISVVRIRWPHSEKLPEVHVLEAYRFTDGITEQVDFVNDLCWKYPEPSGEINTTRPCRVVYESNSQQHGHYKNTFANRHPEIRLVPIYTSGANKADTELGLTVIKTLVRQNRLSIPQSQIDSDGVQTLLREVRDLGSEADDHIACSVWFVVSWVFKQVRMMNSSHQDPTESARRFAAQRPGFFRPRTHVGGRGWRR
jgi:hypothetical protein